MVGVFTSAPIYKPSGVKKRKGGWNPHVAYAKQIRELRSAHDRLQIENQKLSASISHLLVENEALNDRLARLTSEKAILEKNYAAFEQILSKLAFGETQDGN